MLSLWHIEQIKMTVTFIAFATVSNCSNNEPPDGSSTGQRTEADSYSVSFVKIDFNEFAIKTLKPINAWDPCPWVITVIFVEKLWKY